MARLIDPPPAVARRYAELAKEMDAAIFELRRAYLASADDRLKAVAGPFPAPGVRPPAAG